jgi:hypothetical protein
MVNVRKRMGIPIFTIRLISTISLL